MDGLLVKCMFFLFQFFIACGLGNGRKTRPDDPFRKPNRGMWRLMEKNFYSDVQIDMKNLEGSLSIYLSLILLRPPFLSLSLSLFLLHSLFPSLFIYLLSFSLSLYLFFFFFTLSFLLSLSLLTLFHSLHLCIP